MSVVPWSFKKEEAKVVSTTTHQLAEDYIKAFIEKERYGHPLFDVFLQVHYNPKFRKALNRLLNSDQGGVILPTGSYEGVVLSYVSEQHAGELVANVKAREKANMERDKKARAARYRTSLDKENERKVREEKRIPTGVRNTTVLDPSSFGNMKNSYKKHLKVYSGHPNGVNLGTVQEKHYQTLSDILKRSNKKFNYVGYAAYEGLPAYNSHSGNSPTLTRFVMTAPGFVWEKYEGDTAGGGRNTVYVGGKVMKLTDFLLEPANYQDKLIRGK